MRHVDLEIEEVPTAERRVVASSDELAVHEIDFITYIFCLFLVPYFKKTIKRPFYASDPVFLILIGILSRQCVRRKSWPVVAQVKV